MKIKNIKYVRNNYVYYHLNRLISHCYLRAWLRKRSRPSELPIQHASIGPMYVY